MGAISATDIISIIQSEIENFNWDEASRETGNVIWVGDGIATVYGIDHAMYGEIVVFDNGVKGMVQDIRENEIGVILFGRDTGIKEGTKVVRTKKKAGIPVGSAFVGRVINALGEPIDGNGDINEEDYRPIARKSRRRGFVGSVKISWGVPCSWILPSAMNSTRLATSLANPISWVTTIIVMPPSASFFISSSTSPTISGSSADVGSSNRITSGFIASVRAIAIRCF